MGKHAKPGKSIKQAVKYGAVAATVPAAAFVFSAPAAHAATAGQWDAIAQCESAGDWHIESGDPPGPPGTGASAWGGGLQFQPASWNAAIAGLQSMKVDTSHFGIHASSSTKQQQILAAEELESQPGQGAAAWATSQFGNGCAFLGPSMFSGGANPWGLPGARIPTSVINGSSGDAFPTDLSDGGTPATPPPPPVVTPPPTAPTPTPRHGHHHGRHRRHHHHVPPVVTPPTTPPPAVSPPSCDHIVVAGDTVSAVAKLNGASLAEVEAVNPGIVAGSRPDDFSLIFAGGHIHLPAPHCDGNQ